MGVHLAVAIAEDACKNGEIFSLGPLIHNQRVIKDLESKGLKVLKRGENPPPLSAVIISAHGISPLREKELNENCAVLLDATCPNVKANQKTAESYSKKGYYVFLAGEKNHSEIIGISGYITKKGCNICSNTAEAEEAAKKLKQKAGNEKTVLIGQTTINPALYNAIGEKIRLYFPQLKIINTICDATEKRQEALKKLCKKAEAIIVIGGKESSNTRQLCLIAQEQGKDAFLVETVEDIPEDIKKYNTVGICAGASSPLDYTTEIITYITSL